MNTLAADVRPANPVADPTPADDPEFARLIAAVAAMKVESDRFHREIFDPAMLARAPELEALSKRSDELIDEWSSAEARVVQHPVSTAADLLRKLNFMEEYRYEHGEESGKAITADVRRVVANEVG